jgi:hypothetical protein
MIRNLSQSLYIPTAVLIQETFLLYLEGIVPTEHDFY